MSAAYDTRGWGTPAAHAAAGTHPAGRGLDAAASLATASAWCDPDPTRKAALRRLASILRVSSTTCSTHCPSTTCQEPS